jgi:hypothetical protein
MFRLWPEQKLVWADMDRGPYFENLSSKNCPMIAELV